MIKLVKPLSDHEKFYLNRKRSGKTQKQLAEDMNLNEHTIRDIEFGRSTAPETQLQPGATPGEILKIARRRMGITISEAAEMVGITNQWLIQQEGDKVSINSKVLNFYSDHILVNE